MYLNPQIHCILTQAGAAHRGTRLSAAHTITMSLFYQTITVLCEGGILKAFDIRSPHG